MAWIALDPRLRRRRKRLQVPIVKSSFNLLRAMHSGMIGDYVFSIVAGVVVFGVTLL